MDYLLQSMVNQNYVHVLFEKVKKKSWSINFLIVGDIDNYFFKLKWNELHSIYLLYKNRNIMELILLSLYWYSSPMPKFLMGCVISLEKS